MSQHAAHGSAGGLAAVPAGLVAAVVDLVGTGPVPVTHVPWIYVDDLDAHFATASGAGAKIVEPISQHGFRAYQAEDLEGHRWTFVQARPTMR